MELKDRICVITGAASGIGAATARAFQHEGAQVIVVDRNAQGAKAVADEVGGLAVECDVSKEEQVENLVETVVSQYGQIDLFFSNAGVTGGGGFLETPIDEWQRQWEINVMGHVYAVRAVLPAMLERGEGYLVSTASMAGILIAHSESPYTATKHAAVGLAKWLSITYHDRGIRSSLLAPLGVNTPMLAGTDPGFAKNAGGPIREPEEVAQQVVDGVREERFLILTDPIAQDWMQFQVSDNERWLTGMRRLQTKISSDDS